MSEPTFHDATAARDYLECARWPDSPVRPQCGTVDVSHRLPPTEKVCEGDYKGVVEGCRKQYSVKVGAVFDRSNAPLRKWFKTAQLMCASVKGKSGKQVERMTGLSYPTAWFMSHRICEAMKGPVISPLGGKRTEVEANGTFRGNRKKQCRGVRRYAHREEIISLVERGSKLRSFHVQSVSSETRRPRQEEQIAEDAAVMTEDMGAYPHIHEDFVTDGLLRHGRTEHPCGRTQMNMIAHCISLPKCVLAEVYQYIGANHPSCRHLEGFDPRYNSREPNESEQVLLALSVLAGND